MIRPINTKDPVDRITPEWERIEADYRAGLLSLRAIAAKHGSVSEGAIRKRARRFEWNRDLRSRILAKADEIVRKQMVRSTHPATASEPTEAAIVADNAQLLARIELTQRKDVTHARSIVVRLFAELEELTDERTAAELSQSVHLLVGIERRGGDEKADRRAREAFSKAISLPARASTAKALADALRTLVMLEREAWGLGPDNERSAQDQSSKVVDVVDIATLTREERQRLRQLLEKAQAQNALIELHTRESAAP